MNTNVKTSEANLFSESDSDQKKIIVKVDGIYKTVTSGFIPKKKEILKNVSLTVKEGEIFGFLGHNGAGKTTTIKAIMGLIYQDKGTINLFGESNLNPSSREKIGFLPESPNFYLHLTGYEFLNFYGQLFGINKKERQNKIAELINLVHLEGKQNIHLKKYSKGMLQRIGIAQALINSPDLLILDEPMSGLDPVGRKDIRDIIINLKKKGKTVLFSTHILSDAEMICDSIAIMIRGEVKKEGNLHNLIDNKSAATEITFTGLSHKELPQKDFTLIGSNGNEYTVAPKSETIKNDLIKLISNKGGSIISVAPKRQLLEQLFMDKLNNE